MKVDWALLPANILGFLFTGNRYKRDNGKTYVKHPKGKWIRIDKHLARQRRLRENK